MCRALGIINMSGIMIEGLTDTRPLSAISVLGRYRLIDFPLSNMSNSGISQIQVYIKDKPRSLIEHIGIGRQYNVNSKRGRVHLLGGESKILSDAFNHDINAFTQNMRYVDDVNLPFVIIVPAHFIFKCDLDELLQEHIASSADVTMLYKNTDNAKEEFFGCDCLILNKSKHVVAIENNRANNKTRAISLETYIMSKEMFKKLVKQGTDASSMYWLKDILQDNLDTLDVQGVALRGFTACINSMKAYYKANMDLKRRENLALLQDEDWPCYTRTNDSPPAKYGENAIVQDAVLANGCVVDGTVLNSVIGRNTIIKEGAVVKNCVILADAIVESGIHIENAVIDKRVSVQQKSCIKGPNGDPIYLKKYANV